MYEPALVVSGMLGSVVSLSVPSGTLCLVPGPLVPSGTLCSVPSGAPSSISGTEQSQSAE